MSNIQGVAPNLGATDVAGACLRFTQRVFRNQNPLYYRSAWIAWENAVHKRLDRAIPTDVAVPVYFAHWGEYNDGRGQYGTDPNRPYYGNWGHVASAIPGRGFLSSPTNGEGAQWFPTIEAIERAFNCSYVGWAFDVGGLSVAWPASTPPITAQEDNVKTFGGRSERSEPQVIGDVEQYVTFLDSWNDDKWGDRTLMRGPGVMVSSNIDIVFEGEPGTRVALRLIRETAAGKNVHEYKPDHVTLNGYGRAVAKFGLATTLADGQLVRVLAKAQHGKKVKVVDFIWDGTRAGS